MLQIISGKFFKSNELYETHCKGILYSNFSYFKTIDTCILKLEPVETFNSIANSYVADYTNKIEKGINSGGIQLVKIGDSEIMDQFKLLASFGLKAFFDIEKNTVISNCRKTPINLSDKYLPSIFVSRFFDENVRGDSACIEAFIKLVNKVLSLERKKYETVMKCLQNFYNALQVLSYNFDLAYSMLIYCLETLVQNYDEYVPIWDDYETGLKNRLEIIFNNIDTKYVNDIKAELLKSSNLKLQYRFINFISNHIECTFFKNEAFETLNPLCFSDLRQVLKNAYSLRSKYVHKLNPILQQIKIPAMFIRISRAVIY
jgi:hypothetical protein